MNRIGACDEAASRDEGGSDSAGALNAHTQSGPASSGSRTTRLPAHHEPAADADEAPEKALRILVVEDNIDQAHSLAELLELWGHDVVVAHDGLAGVERARSFRPDVIIMDIGLPLLDGYQVARRLRADPATSRIYLIALTGYGQDEDRRQAFAAGFELHLTKPADLEALRRALRSAGTRQK